MTPDDWNELLKWLREHGRDLADKRDYHAANTLLDVRQKMLEISTKRVLAGLQA